MRRYLDEHAHVIARQSALDDGHAHLGADQTCRVMWGFVAPDMNIFMRAGFAAMGGCASKRIGIMFGTDQPIASATIDGWVVGGKPGKVEIAKDAKSFRMPFYDRGIGNDSHVHVTMRP